MPGARQKYNFYAVLNGREIGIYTNWPQTGDSVLGFAKAKYKGYITYSEAKSAMANAEIHDFKVFDGQTTYSKQEYEELRVKQVCPTGKNSTEDYCDNREEARQNITELSVTPRHEFEHESATVYIDGSCTSNGSDNAKDGYGVFWGDSHPWNGSYSLAPEEGATNNKAELKAAIRAVEIANDNHIKSLVVNSDSRYVISGITEWIERWCDNGWRTASGEPVKNKEEWIHLLKLVKGTEMSITWNHVYGHSGISGNEEADKLAVQGATRPPTDQHNIDSKCTAESSLHYQDSEQKIIDPNCKIDTHVHTKTLPKVIIISKKFDPKSKQDVLIAEEQVKSTPRRKLTTDNTNTPVPGSINGSSIYHNSSNRNPVIRQKESHTTPIDNDMLIKVIKNMETVLESVVLEVHKSREDQQTFKREVNSQLKEITSKQVQFADTLSTISKDFEEGTKHKSQVEHLDKASASQAVSAKSFSEVQAGIFNLQRNVNNKLEAMKASLHMVESSCTDIKRVVDKNSTVYKKNWEGIQTVSRKILDAVSEVRDESKRTREQMGEVEKSMNLMSAAEEFQLPVKGAKKKVTEKSNIASKQSSSHDDTEEVDDDIEITFPKIIPINGKDSGISQQESKKSDKDSEDTTAKKILDKTTDEKEKDELRNTRSRKQKVYVIGDSIAGQLNIPVLGKSTNTYVRRIKAPKIQDIEKHAEETKDAKLIIVHTGINNLREQEEVDLCVNSLVEAVTSLTEAAPGAKIAISKLIPVGERELHLDNMLLNAKYEKKLQEVHSNNVTFIDHSNLAEQGIPIKKYYRQDQIHLSDIGTITFTNNLKREITTLLKQKEGNDEPLEMPKPNERAETFSGKRYRSFDSRSENRVQRWNTKHYGRFDRNRSYNKSTWREYDETHHSNYNDRNRSRRTPEERRQVDYYYDDDSRYSNDRYNVNPSYGSRHDNWRTRDSVRSYHRDDNSRHDYYEGRRYNY